MAKTTKSIADEILRYAQTKQAGADQQVPEKDPADKGPASCKEDPDLQKVPGKDTSNGTKNPADCKIDGTQTHGNDGNPPATEDGNKREDAYQQPNTPLSKIATRGAKISEGILGLINSKSASQDDSKPEGSKNSAATKEAGKDADESEDSKQAGEDILAKIDGDILKKVATHVLETEEGKNFVIETLTKKAGQEAAERLIKEASDEAEAIALYEQYQFEQVQQAHLQKQAFDEQFNQLEEKDQAYVTKAAKVHSTQLEKIENPILKQAYAQGVVDADPMMGEEPGVIPGADEAPSLEQIAMILEAMVAQGEVSEEDALAALEILAAELGGAGMEGDPAMADPTMAGDPAMAGPDEMEGYPKMASEESDEDTDKILKRAQALA